MEQLKNQSKLDRNEKALEEVKESKGNELKFGANIQKFVPPPPKKGG